MACLDFLTAEDAKKMHAKTAEESNNSKGVVFFALSAGISSATFALKDLFANDSVIYTSTFYLTGTCSK
jgi:hypothetical protein